MANPNSTYVAHAWQNDMPPALSAENLSEMDDQIEALSDNGIGAANLSLAQANWSDVGDTWRQTFSNTDMSDPILTNSSVLLILTDLTGPLNSCGGYAVEIENIGSGNYDFIVYGGCPVADWTVALMAIG